MIGIFDSGVGGLGIYKEMKRLLPKESIIYLADLKNFPYGEKSEKEIKQIAVANTKFLVSCGCNIIVIACNTASTIALQFVRQHISNLHSRCVNINIVGVVPVVKTTAEVSKNKRIGISATKKTIKSKYLQNLVDKFCPKEKGFRVFYQEANELVELVENFFYCHPEGVPMGRPKDLVKRYAGFFPSDSEGQNDKMKIIKKYLNKFIKSKVDVIALGCTHFPFLRTEIEKIMGLEVTVLDSNGAVARQVARIATNLQFSTDNLQPEYKFYTSGNPEKVKPTIEKLLGEKIDLTIKSR